MPATGGLHAGERAGSRGAALRQYPRYFGARTLLYSFSAVPSTRRRALLRKSIIARLWPPLMRLPPRRPSANAAASAVQLIDVTAEGGT